MATPDSSSSAAPWFANLVSFPNPQKGAADRQTKKNCSISSLDQGRISSYALGTHEHATAPATISFKSISMQCRLTLPIAHNEHENALPFIICTRLVNSFVQQSQKKSLVFVRFSRSGIFHLEKLSLEVGNDATTCYYSIIFKVKVDSYFYTPSKLWQNRTAPHSQPEEKRK